MRKGRELGKAAKYLEKLEARFPYGRFAQQAQLELGYVYWKAMNPAPPWLPATALSSCTRATRRRLRLLPEGADQLQRRPRPDRLHQSQDPTERDPKAARESFEAFKELVTRFPDSKYTPDATLRMNYLVNAMASLEVHVARYYAKRGAYVAAANRAQQAIKTYPQAPAIEEAMYILVTAYDKMGMTDLRDDADRVMKKNFPNSRFYKDGLERKTAWWKLW
jgi:outer membrane protein assembly factor BamD